MIVSWAGHVRRVRDQTTDGRVAHLRYTERGIATGMASFGPLGTLTEHSMEQFTSDELAVISRFLVAAASAMHDHLDSPCTTADQQPREADT